MSPNDDMRLRTSKDIGALIRQRRHELDLSQLELAERVGVSRQWVVDVERGKPRAELGLVLRTLDVLDVRLHVDGGPQAKEKALSGPAGADVDAIVRAARKPRP
jgi:HTH-type transcriptional regulator / antitoxin HipB